MKDIPVPMTFRMIEKICQRVFRAATTIRKMAGSLTLARACSRVNPIPAGAAGGGVYIGGGAGGWLYAGGGGGAGGGV